MEQQNTPEMANSQQRKSKPQKPKLKTFEIIQKNLATIAITRSLVDQSYPFNKSILCGFLALSSFIYCTLMFIIFDAKTFAGYTQSICAWSMGALIMLCLLILILEVEKLFELINGCDTLVNTSECELQKYFLK